VCPHHAFVPICSLNLISPEVPYRHTSRQNPTPAVYTNCGQQQQHGPGSESQQHPHWHGHDITSQLSHNEKSQPRRTKGLGQATAIHGVACSVSWACRSHESSDVATTTTLPSRTEKGGKLFGYWPTLYDYIEANRDRDFHRQQLKLQTEQWEGEGSRPLAKSGGLARPTAVPAAACPKGQFGRPFSVLESMEGAGTDDFSLGPPHDLG
jgi:hypothetical protein